MPRQLRRRLWWLATGAAGALAALRWLTSCAPLSFDWGGERLILRDGGAGLTYWGIGCEWADLAHWPRVEMRFKSPWDGADGPLHWYWRPVKGGFTFSSNQRIAYFPLYMLLPPLVLAAWFLRVPKYAFSACQRCGYNLTGNVSGRCPECGKRVTCKCERGVVE